ncbi:MAG: hypothetical protein ACUVRY_03435 [Thermoanaerobaculaceae bacterium]
MGKLDLNLDAYRLLAQLLHRLRRAVREELSKTYGSQWERGIPEDLRMFLSQRRQREQSISWFTSDSVDLLDYANFADLAEVLASTPSLLERLDWLPSSGREAMLRVRLLELDTVFQRVAYARPISEMEMELLAGLGERIKKCFDQGACETTKPATPEALPRREHIAGKVKAGQPSPELLGEQSQPIQEARGHLRDQEALKGALEKGDTKTIMLTLYKEVVAAADAIFKEGKGPACPAWELVRESSWYEENFSKLALAPLSHFFDILEDAKELGRSATREEVLEAVGNRGFTQTLLQLKEMFQPFLSSR